MVRRRKATSKSACFRLVTSGPSWPFWRPFGEAGGRWRQREGHL